QEIYKDRQKFSEQVFNVASSDLVNMGISVVSYTLKDIQDDQVTTGTVGDLGTLGTMGVLGMLGTMRAFEAVGTLGTHQAPWGHSACLETSPREGDKSQGCPHVPSCPQLSPRALGTSRGLGDTQHVARTQQAIAAQRAQVALVERAQRAQLQEHEVGRRERELEATVRKPAEAERYRLERLAEAQR
ncbi:FLOT1 protein, partial [Alopecoenas beccarii]|nr:FLOT1 protein [Alopecoenas beccarii]